MRPAPSVILFTTAAGMGQGLMLVAYAGAQCAAWRGVRVPPDFSVQAAYIAAALAIAGLIASFFHLGHPERAWRAAAMWRTSWLSREVIVLPAFIALTLIHGYALSIGSSLAPWLGLLTALVCAALYVCTAMIYICLKFLREWATPLTFANFLLMGLASGATLATLLVSQSQPSEVPGYAWAAAGLTFAAAVVRIASLIRNARLQPRSTLQSATGLRQQRIAQVSKGFTGAAFNTREFFHGASDATLRAVKWGFLLSAFVLPILLVAYGSRNGVSEAFLVAVLVQYLGMLAERWFFFAQASHPQNLYYQAPA